MIRFIALALSLLASSASTFAQSTGSASQEAGQITFVANKSRFCVGEAPQYVVTGTSNFAGRQIVWTSAFQPYDRQGDPTPTAENHSYNTSLSMRDGVSFWRGAGSVWQLNQVGMWTKTATVAGANISSTFPFTVEFCGREAHRAYFLRVSPEDGTNLYRPDYSDAYQVFTFVLEGLTDRSRIESWRVVLNNQNITDLIQKSGIPGGYIDVFEHSTPGQCCMGISPGVGIRFSYPLRGLLDGRNFFHVTAKLVDGSEHSVGANYPVRRMIDGMRAFPASMPESRLECHNNQRFAGVERHLHFNATGGDGTYSWSLPSDVISAGDGLSFVTYFRNPGAYNITVTSGKQQAVCTVHVLPEPPMPPMPPGVAVPMPTTPPVPAPPPQQAPRP